MRKWLLGATMLLTAAAADAADWHIASMSGDHPNRVMTIIDMDSIQRNGDEVRYWSKVISETPSDARLSDIAVYSSANCRLNSATIIRAVVNYSDGRTETQEGDNHSQSATPDSNLFQELSFACGRRTDLGTRLDDPVATVRSLWRSHPSF